MQTGRAIGRENGASDLITLPYLSVASVKDGHVDLSVVKTMQVTPSEAARFALKRGDVLFTEGGDADKLGRGCVWDGRIDPCLHQNHVFAVRPKSELLRSEFLDVYARSSAGRAYFLSCAKQTTNLASINSSQLKAMHLSPPSLEEQDRIISILRSIKLAIDSTASVLEHLVLIRIATAELLLSGHISMNTSSL